MNSLADLIDEPILVPTAFLGPPGAAAVLETEDGPILFLSSRARFVAEPHRLELEFDAPVVDFEREVASVTARARLVPIREKRS